MINKTPTEEPVLLPPVRPVDAGKTFTSRAAKEILHELQVHQIELETQNETLRQMQIALEESRDRYVDLYDFAPVGYITLTAAALIAEINLTAAALLGEARNKLYQRRFARFVRAEDSDRWYQTFQEIAKHGGRKRCEVTLQRADGSRFDAQLDYLLPESAHGEPVIRIALSDITERKRAEAELRIAAIAFETHDGMMVTDPNGQFTFDGFLGEYELSLADQRVSFSLTEKGQSSASVNL